MLNLKIYNSLTKQKETFKPIIPGNVSMYVCGVTVYDYCHIGHARTYLVFDMIHRYLKYSGFNVNYVRNITDIDDKIIKRSQENNESCEALTERFINAMHEDLNEKLNILNPTEEPKATEYVAEMIELIDELIQKNYAYVASNGDVYYNVKNFKTYGCLSHRDLDDLLSGARIEVNESKQNPLDFVLWKKAKAGEPEWDSPWGKGRPGWHTECAVMSLKIFGNTFDIHGGGHDLKFPHHENERAQAEACTNKTFVNTWMHAGFLQIDKEKMSKSLGNFITIREFLKSHHGEVLRYFNIASHYRSPVEFSPENIAIAESALERLYNTIRGFDGATPGGAVPDLDWRQSIESLSPVEIRHLQRFKEAMDDDFNTPIALSVLFDLAREINREKDRGTAHAQIMPLIGLLKKLANTLGLLLSTAEEFFQYRKNLTSSEVDEIEQLIQQREIARKNKNWQEADRIRQALTAKGIELEDTVTKTLWRAADMKEKSKEPKFKEREPIKLEDFKLKPLPSPIDEKEKAKETEPKKPGFL